jgi:2-polyprenyl-3-methyl-5-hydroxy-6-metoxy-1,4-benzoquinol methylase
MNPANRYDYAAPTWDQKVRRLGYTKAYGAFLAGNTVSRGPTLDIGTGSGAMALSWIEAGGSTELTLLDPSAAMLQRASLQCAQRGIHPNLAQCKIEDFCPQAGFSAIMAAHVLEHFSNPGERLHHIAQMLRPGGYLYLVVSKPHWCNWLIWLRFRHRWIRPEAVCAMAAAAGLRKQMLHSFHTGPPSRTSLGYIFSKP